MVEIINGVVLRTIKYSDNLMIADIYTLQHGRRSFLLPVTRSKRSRVRSVLFQPLSIITFSASTNARSLARISDAQPLLLYSTIPYDVVKSSIALYLAEVLTYALHEQQSDEALFTYIDRALTWFDAASDGYADFHLVFMAQLLRFLGISPNLEGLAPNSYLDMQAGCLVREHPLHPHFLMPDATHNLVRLFAADFLSVRSLSLNRELRREFLATLEEYYRLHIPDFPPLRSGDVLKELFAV